MDRVRITKKLYEPQTKAFTYGDITIVATESIPYLDKIVFAHRLKALVTACSNAVETDVPWDVWSLIEWYLFLALYTNVYNEEVLNVYHMMDLYDSFSEKQKNEIMDFCRLDYDVTKSVAKDVCDRDVRHKEMLGANKMPFAESPSGTQELADRLRESLRKLKDDFNNDTL